ncbi:TetR/AcrR family transcriptional regulator [Maledivibacter halophilus]|uniref:Transcriptional regulator, TetR family n=1 Tax=Maledivibacter halophilus TaxID=36842 RepID=A0A1T5MRB4_9FIRM|nr:TetR/AcrR family transcriptional regulator [Maledivibacter halophilus]SKC90732.1 transcriptional regulator, TetR family [Maledivibacter halophilus]
MNKKEIQKRRMMSYFIEAVNQIIETDGIEAITIRKVSDMAGYNSATLYNYFENLDHLIFFASMKYLKEYVTSLPKYLKNVQTPIDKYFGIWKCFCYHSFSKPKIYYRIFFDKFSNSLNDDIKEYYKIFPEELGDQSLNLLPMLLGQNIYDRNRSILKSFVNNLQLKKEDLEDINEMTILIYQGMLSRILNEQTDYSIDEATDKTLFYMKQIIRSYTNCHIN